MTNAATQVSHAQVARIHEANELGAFVVQDGVRTDGVRGRTPDIRVARMNVGFQFARGVAVAAVTVDATEMKRRRKVRLLVRITGVFVARHATPTLGGSRLHRLPQKFRSAPFLRTRQPRDTNFGTAFVRARFDHQVRQAAREPELVSRLRDLGHWIRVPPREGEHAHVDEYPDDDDRRHPTAARVTILLMFDHDGVLALFDRLAHPGLRPLKRECELHEGGVEQTDAGRVGFRRRER